MKVQEDKFGVRHVRLKRKDGDKFFVLADTHAFFEPMRLALEKNGFDAENSSHKVILLGDMLDRGPDAKKVFEFFDKIKDRLVYVRGNHEDMFFKCLDEFRQGRLPNYAHFLNGTVDTIMQFCGISSFADFSWIYEAGDERRQRQLADRIDAATEKLVALIDEKSVDYATLDDYIFVHGYIPCSLDPFTERYSPVSNWKRGDWEAARWAHGTRAWHDGVRVEGKTIMCGHWHTSEAHSLYHYHGSEWDADADFSPFEDDGIVALDACTAYSGICNCVTL